MKSFSVTRFKRKPTEQCFFVVLFIMLYKVVLTFAFVNELHHLNETTDLLRASSYEPG